MSMQQWTDEELATTRDQLDAWSQRHGRSGWGPKLWIFTALLGAFAISTGFAFIFFDGVTVMSVVLMLLGSVTCYSWYRSDRQQKDNVAFLAEVNKELKHRKKKGGKSKSETKGAVEDDAVKVEENAKK